MLPEPINGPLLAQIIANPEERNAYAVYADWLLSRGARRGELISVELALEGAVGAEHDRLEETARELRSALLESAPADEGTLVAPYQWRRGFVSDVGVLMARPAAGQLRRLFDSPAATLVRHVSLACTRNWPEYGETVEVLAEVAPELSRLTLANSGFTSPAGPLLSRLTRFSRLSALLIADASVPDDAPPLPTGLTELRLMALVPPDPVLRPLATGRYAALHTLALDLPVNEDHLVLPLLGSALPSLRELRLGPSGAIERVEAAIHSGLMKRLARLVLTLEPHQVHALIELAPRLGEIELHLRLPEALRSRYPDLQLPPSRVTWV